MNKVTNASSKNNKRTICLPFEELDYESIVGDANKFRNYLDIMIETYPELFPPAIQLGYRMKDIRRPKKQKISIRRIEIDGISYTIHPSFVMPYMTGLVKDVEKVIFLRKFAVPFWALSRVFGRNPMYWYRIEQNIGGNSVVGTTVSDPQKLPAHLCGDEKHSWLNGDKRYVATTVGDDCILGVCVANSAGKKDLENAYGDFKREATILNPQYSPKTVNTDSWESTQKAWKALFVKITIISCFLHIVNKIRDRSKRKHKSLYRIVIDRLWKCYRKDKRQCFSQSVCQLYNWALKENVPEVILNPISKLRHNLASYAVAYNFPGAHRTSNMLERVMQPMDRFLFSIRYFHGKTTESATKSIRAWALIHNFAPFNPGTIKKRGYRCPAEKLNGGRYHDSWLQNLLVSASLQGFRTPPQNP